MILSRSDIDRMRESVAPVPENHTREMRKQELKLLSEAKVKNWPNTLEGMRHKKETFLKDREEYLEQQRQDVDLQEAEVRRVMRVESIKRANELMYEQTDKMKNLRSQQLYCDVLKTRDDQIDFKKKTANGVKKTEADHHQVILEQVRVGNAKEQDKMAKKEAQIKIIAESREVQLEEVRKKRQGEKDRDVAIGKVVRRQAEINLEEDLVLSELKNKRAKESSMQMLRANQRQKDEKEEMKAQEAIMEGQRREQIEKIDVHNRARKALEQRKFERAQVQRQKIIDAAVKQMAEMSLKEGSITTKQAAEKIEKEDKYNADKEAKREKEWAETVESRSRMKEVKIIAAKKDAEESNRLNELANKHALLSLAAEKEKERKLREMTMTIKGIQLEAAVEKKRLQASNNVTALEQDALLRTLGDSDDRKFDAMARKVIGEYSAAGKNVTPLVRALEYVQPQLIPAMKNKIPPKED